MAVPSILVAVIVAGVLENCLVVLLCGVKGDLDEALVGEEKVERNG